MTIHREGYKIIIATAFSLLIINFILMYYAGFNDFTTKWLLVGFSGLMFAFVVSFFRDPLRSTLTSAHTSIISPADGKVVAIEEVEETEYFKDRRIQVSVFMSPGNVHINWCPVSGEIKYLRYHPGKYLVAWHPKSSTENERNTVVIDTGQDAILIRQIAGFLARRIVHYTSVGKQVSQGHQMGFIKFGSRVDVFLPLHAQVKVQLNDKVKGGQTILAEW